MDNLKDKKCVPCEGGMPTLPEGKIKEYLAELEGWDRNGEVIQKDFLFKNFKEALAFINKVGEVAEAEGHHPDILLYEYKHVRISLSTHAIGGLSDNDFILAAKIDAVR